eukprot:GHRQ01037546.1.p1 GENE.GHRQ01037546.1~~GHRQ01037546.1.p1  ORF type:complete len:104 (+),score=5.59 GHRQ01037546.1:260-571(+)
MAAQLYSNTQLAQALYEVLQELVGDGKVPEELAVATLDQVNLQLTLRNFSPCAVTAAWYSCKPFGALSCRVSHALFPGAWPSQTIEHRADCCVGLESALGTSS